MRMNVHTHTNIYALLQFIHFNFDPNPFKDSVSFSDLYVHLVKMLWGNSEDTPKKQ